MKLLLTWDKILSQRLQGVFSRGWLRNVAAFLARSGDSWFWVAGLMVLWFFAPVEQQPVLLSWLICVIVGAAIVMGIKFLIRRRRPEGGWGGIYRRTDPHSFPSGHAVRAFMLVGLGFLSMPLYVAIGLSVWAPLVALARVSMGVHYLSDVLAGALLGLVFAGIGALLLPI